jgi:ubiquinone/menaquinone biosynthesis C-methylase UbiE
MDKNNNGTVWNQLASAYQEKFMYLDLYNDTYDTFCDLIEKKNPTILELGCGPGNITRYILNRRPDFQILATDAAPNMVALAQENNPQASFQVLDCRALDSLNQKADAIVCGFCIPYLSEAETVKLIGDCAGILPKEGILYFSLIEDDYSKSGIQKSSNGEHQTFVYYYSEAQMLQMLESNGFTKLHVFRKEYLLSTNIKSIHLIVIARKN